MRPKHAWSLALGVITRFPRCQHLQPAVVPAARFSLPADTNRHAGTEAHIEVAPSSITPCLAFLALLKQEAKS